MTKVSFGILNYVSYVPNIGGEILQHNWLCKKKPARGKQGVSGTEVDAGRRARGDWLYD